MARRSLSIPRLPVLNNTPGVHAGGDHWYSAALRRYRVSEDGVVRSLVTYDEDRHFWGVDRVRQTVRMRDATGLYIPPTLNVVTVTPVACHKGDVFNFAVMLAGPTAAKNVHDWGWVALYDTDDQLIAQTNQIVGWTVEAVRRFQFPTQVTIPADGIYYVAVYNSGSGLPGDVAAVPPTSQGIANAFGALQNQYTSLAKQPSRSFTLPRLTIAAPSTIPATTQNPARPLVSLLPS